MRLSHALEHASNISEIALNNLCSAIKSKIKQAQKGVSFEQIEKEIHAAFIEAERVVLSETLEKYDIDLPTVMYEGKEYRQVVRCEQTDTKRGRRDTSRTLTLSSIVSPEFLYKKRWHIEVDLRNIKTTLGMETLSCKTPEMVEKEMWVYFLAYNLIRLLMAQSALLPVKKAWVTVILNYSPCWVPGWVGKCCPRSF